MARYTTVNKNKRTEKSKEYRPIVKRTIIEHFSENLAQLGYSITGGTPTVVRIKGITSIEPIGSLVRKITKRKTYSEKVVYRNEDIEQFHVPPDANLEALCFNANHKLCYSPIKAVARHKLPEGSFIYTIRTETGRVVQTTGAHSVFSFKDGEVKPVFVSCLSRGDYICVPLDFPNHKKTITEINLLDKIMELPHTKTKTIYLTEGVKKVLEDNETIKNKIKSNSYFFYYYAIKQDILPVNVLRGLSAEDISFFSECKISTRNREIAVPARFKLDKDTMDIFGLYVAKGYIEKRRVSFSFEAHESELINHIRMALLQKFNLKTMEVKPRKTTIQVRINGALFAFLMHDVFKLGSSAKNKRIFEGFLDIDDNMASRFMLAYFAGDSNRTTLAAELLTKEGCMTAHDMLTLTKGKQTTIKTTSKHLFTELSYLLSYIGVRYSLEGHSQKKIGNKKRYLIRCASGKVPATFAGGGLGLEKVVKITKHRLTKPKYLYDYSVNPHENFIGGYGPICLHNSGLITPQVMVVHELVSNSVVGETPTVIKNGERVEIKPIETVVSDLMGEPKALSELGRLNGGNIRVLCFDKETKKLKYSTLTSVYRHQLPRGSEIYKVKLADGREVTVTGDHSVFSVRDGKVTPVMARDIKKGDFLVVPRAKWQDIAQNSNKRINLLEEILHLPEEQTRRISIYNIRDILSRNKVMKEKIKLLVRAERGDVFYSNYWSRDRLPVNILRKLTPEEIKLFYTCKVGHTRERHHFDIFMDSSLMEFFGLYVAKGSCGKGIVLSFSKDEKEIIEYVKRLIDTKFGVNASISFAHKTAVNIVVPSAFLHFLINKVFKIGKNAKNKNIPNIVFNVPYSLAKRFLWAYCMGNGHPTKKLFRNRDLKLRGPTKITVATASKKLFTDLQYLLSALGFAYSTRMNRGAHKIANGVRTKFSKSYVLYLYPSQKQAPVNMYPIRAGGIEINNWRGKKWIRRGMIRYETIKKLVEKKWITIKNELKSFIEGGLGLLKVTKITKKTVNTPIWVYDYSVNPSENFVGGFGCIVLHNSLDNLQESGRLGDILVKIERTKKDYLKITCKDNGTGLSRDDAVLAFSEMLASSRFVASATRGSQGIGVSGVILYSYQTTNEPTIVKTSTGDSELHILTIKPFGEKEERVIVETVANEQRFRGTIVECCISGTGKGEEGERKLVYLGKDSAGGKGESERTIYSYLRQTAIANPFAKITLIEPDGSKTVFERTSNIVPPLPPITKPHPYGVCVADLVRMRNDAIAKKRYKTIGAFLRGEFIRITPSKVEEISTISGINMETPLNQLTIEEFEKIMESIRKIKFLAPPTNILPPIGREALEAGLRADLRPKYISYVCRKPAISDNGHPVRIEAAAAVGGESGLRGREEDIPVELIRFANRVPLVFSKGDCVIYNTIYPNTKEKQSMWRRWGVDPSATPLTLVVSVMSTRVPYTSPSKMAISEDKVIRREIQLAARDVLLEIGRYLKREKKAEIRARRSIVIRQYLDATVGALPYLSGRPRPPNMAKIYKRLEDEAGKTIDVVPDVTIAIAAGAEPKAIKKRTKEKEVEE